MNNESGRIWKEAGVIQFQVQLEKGWGKSQTSVWPFTLCPL